MQVRYTSVTPGVLYNGGFTMYVCMYVVLCARSFVCYAYITPACGASHGVSEWGSTEDIFGNCYRYLQRRLNIRSWITYLQYVATGQLFDAKVPPFRNLLSLYVEYISGQKKKKGRRKNLTPIYHFFFLLFLAPDICCEYDPPCMPGYYYQVSHTTI